MTDALDRAACAAFQACLAGQLALPPLDCADEGDWDQIGEAHREHWRRIVRAAFDA